MSLENNTQKLNELLDMANSLPEGGGIPYAEGTFVLASNNSRTPIITHNLGTKKLFITIELVADTRQNITLDYSPLFAAINTMFLDYKAKVNYAAYNPNRGDVDVDGSNIANGYNPIGYVLMTPYNTQALDYYAAGIGNVYTNVFATFTDNALTINIGRLFQAGLTYKYRIWGLG